MLCVTFYHFSLLRVSVTGGVTVANLLVTTAIEVVPGTLVTERARIGIVTPLACLAATCDSVSFDRKCFPASFEPKLDRRSRTYW